MRQQPPSPSQAAERDGKLKEGLSSKADGGPAAEGHFLRKTDLTAQHRAQRDLAVLPEKAGKTQKEQLGMTVADA